ncbi:glutamic acid-rich protein-like isoform X2 [Salvia hispanica]|uniref:glutamic acid-rich protein-like isoform X2 n=1 Tax=Salvia hispanica TaxID=49212 RepID=UPI002008F6B8|nr:glutamic acid-rich protein-like isoform X2 [Salvia hispanica]
MDFHSLTRRELQAFCKRNKIPANMTNAAMADALTALQIVEGIEDFMQTSQSESTQSSMELQDSLEVTSPYVPPTGGRSTRQRNVSNAEPVLMTTARRTTRKTAVKAQADAMETPAVAAQASRRRVQIAPTCLELDSQLEKCVEQKKDALMTPAAVGATSRRRRAEETEKKVYSTRRSTRLAVKSMPMLSGETELSNEELFAKDCEDQEVNQKEVSGVTVENVEEDKEKSELSSNELCSKDCEDKEVDQKELSGITVKNTDEDKEKSELSNDELSAEDCEDQKVNLKEDQNELSGITGADAVENMEDKENSEKDITMGEVEKGTDFAVEVEHNEEICDNTEYPADEDTELEVQQSEGCVDAPKCETEEVTVENSKQVEDIETDAGSKDEAVEFESKCETEVTVENSKEDYIETNAGSEDDAAEFESKCETEFTVENSKEVDNIEIDAGSEDEAAEFESKCETEVTVGNLNEVDDDETDAGSEDEVDDDETDAGSEDDAAEFESKVVVSDDDEVEVECEDDHDLNVTLGKLTEMRLEHEVDFGIHEETKKTETETVQVEESEEMELKKAETETMEVEETVAVQEDPVETNKANNGTELVIAEDDAIKAGKDKQRRFEEESLRKLSKMLKEKLQISSKRSSKSGGNEVSQRSALQELPENTLIGGNGK